MTYRERFKAIMEKRSVDRVPYDLAGTSLSAVTSEKTVDGLRAFLGIGGAPSPGYDKFDERILKALDIDFRRVGELYEPNSPLSGERDGVRYDCWGIGRKFTGLYWDIVYSPLKGATLKELEQYPFPKAEDIPAHKFEEARAQAKYLYNETEYVVCAEHPCYGVMELGCWMCGFEDFLYRMAAEPEFVIAFFDRVLSYQKDLIELCYGKIREYIHLTTSGDDFGTQNAPFISKVMFDELVKQYYKERIAYTKRFTNAYFFHHTCGSVFDLIPSLIDAGVEILNPIQPGANRMEPRRLKEAFGDKLTFWGGVDTKELLTAGTPEEVSQSVTALIKDMGGTGFVLSPAHNLQPDVRVENIAAIYKKTGKGIKP